MADGGLLLPILGGVAYLGPFAGMVSAERALGLPPHAVRRLGALAVAVTEDAKRIATRLRLSNAETRALDSMGHRWWRLAGMDQATARRRRPISSHAELPKAPRSGRCWRWPKTPGLRRISRWMKPR
jgi:poly(A) polymerase